MCLLKNEICNILDFYINVRLMVVGAHSVRPLKIAIIIFLFMSQKS